MYSKVTEEGYYAYPLGEKLSVTTRKAKHANRLLATDLCEGKKEDKFMLAYSPSNCLYFSPTLIEQGNECGNQVSIRLDGEEKRVYIGAKGEYHDSGGIISFSHKLSLNNLATQERSILCSKKSLTTVTKKIKILAVAQNNGTLFGVFSVPNTVGLALGLDEQVGISPKTLKVSNYPNYQAYGLENWFENTKIAEL